MPVSHLRKHSAANSNCFIAWGGGRSDELLFIKGLEHWLAQTWQSVSAAAVSTTCSSLAPHGMPYHSGPSVSSCSPFFTILARSHYFSWPLPSSLQTLATSCCSPCLLRWTFTFLSPKTWVPPHSPLHKIQILSLALCVRIPSQASFWVLPLVTSLSFPMLTAHAPIPHKSLSVPVPLLTLAHVSRAYLSKNTGFTDPQHCSYCPVSQHCTSHVPKSDLDLFYIFRMSFYPFEHTENI